VTPSDAVTVQACNSMSECSTMPVMLEGVTIGTEQPFGYSFQAGAPIYQIPVWVNGTTNHAVACTMSPSIGTLASDCHYTPPATSTTRQETTITVTSSADTNQTLGIPLFIYPQGGIREHFSNDVNTDYGPDTNGNTWFISKGTSSRGHGTANCDWPGATWSGIALAVSDPGLFDTCTYDGSFPTDRYYRFIVPNGTYTVNAYYGIGSSFSAGSWTEGFDSQGVIYSGSAAADPMTSSVYDFLGLSGKTFDLCGVVGGCTANTAGNISLNVTVSDNNLYTAVRGLVNAPLTALEIIPSGAPVAPTITTSCPMPSGTQGTAYSQTLTASGTAPFTWSIASGALPTGLTLSGGVVGGTPTTAGTFTFGIGVTNSVGSGTNSPLSCSIVVNTSGVTIHAPRRSGSKSKSATSR
jgi:hypothetical protein